MKNSIIAIAIATIVSSSAMATNLNDVNANAASFASASTSTFAASTGNGYAAQNAAAGAINASYAGAHNLGTETTGHLTLNKTNWSASVGQVTEGVVYTGSTGSSYSTVSGVKVGNATGASNAGAAQGGVASADATLVNAFGGAKLESNSIVGSGSNSTNIDNGFAVNGTKVGADNVTTGAVGGSTYTAGKSFLYFPVTTTSIVNTSVADVHTSGDAYSKSTEFEFFAIGSTGGIAGSNGGGVAVAP